MSKDDYFEFSAKDKVTPRPKKKYIRRRHKRYMSGQSIVETDHSREPKIEQELTQKTPLKRKRVVFFSALTILGLICASLTLLFITIENKKKNAVAQSPKGFSYSQEAAKRAVNALILGDTGYAKTSDYTGELFEALQKQLSKEETPFEIIKISSLRDASEPAYFEIQTSLNDINPFYVSREGNSHVVDLEATVGINSVKLVELLTRRIKSEPTLRVILDKIIITEEDRYHGVAMVSLPHQKGALQFYFDRNAKVGNILERKFIDKTDTKLTVEIARNDSMQPSSYFITNINSENWVAQDKSILDPEMLDSILGN